MNKSGLKGLVLHRQNNCDDTKWLITEIKDLTKFGILFICVIILFF